MYTQFFGNYLLANGYVTRDQLFSAMRQEADQHMKLGTLAIHAGYMNAAQVDDVVIHQTHQDNRFGELAIQLGYLTEAQVEELLKQQTPAFLSLGQVLLDDNDDTVCQIPIVFRTDAKVIFSHQIFHKLFCGCICLIDSGIFVVFEIIGRTFSENICAKTVQRGTGYIKAVCTVFFPVNFEIIIQRFTVIL